MSVDPLPRRFGPYLLFDKIGEGGMARIYLAHSDAAEDGDQLVAMKQILPTLAESDRFRNLLVSEAELASALVHDNVARVYAFGEIEAMLYISMEYVEGFDLRELLRHCARTRQGLPFEFALHVVGELLTALEYAHTHCDESGRPLAIVHRDVSPSNVLLSFGGQVKLCDFGIARALNRDEVWARESVPGKAGYMSPEAAEGGEVDARSDLFSAGIVLWELLSGRRMYRGEGKAPPTLEQAARAEIPSLPRDDLPGQARLGELLDRALSKDVARRFASAEEFRAELVGYTRAVGAETTSAAFGEWMTQHFADQILSLRKARHLAARALAQGPLVEIKPIRLPSAAAADGTAPRPDVSEAAEARSAGGRPEPSTEAAPPPASSPVKVEHEPAIASFVRVAALVFVVVMIGLWFLR